MAALAGGLLSACAQTHPIPTQLMAKTAVELHVAEQHGAKYSPEGMRLCESAEQALEQSRRHVFRGHNDAAREAAERGYAYAQEARELGERESRARSAQFALEQHAAAPSLGVTSLTAADLTASSAP